MQDGTWENFISSIDAGRVWEKGIAHQDLAECQSYYSSQMENVCSQHRIFAFNKMFFSVFSQPSDVVYCLLYYRYCHAKDMSWLQAWSHHGVARHPWCSLPFWLVGHPDWDPNCIVTTTCMYLVSSWNSSKVTLSFKTIRWCSSHWEPALYSSINWKALILPLPCTMLTVGHRRWKIIEPGITGRRQCCLNRSIGK